MTLGWQWPFSAENFRIHSSKICKFFPEKNQKILKKFKIASNIESFSIEKSTN
jgi:hypothetical protein